MKLDYEQPTLEIIVLKTADVITTSGGGPGENEGPGMSDD